MTSISVTPGVGLVMAAVGLSVTSSAAAARYWWALAAAPLILLALWPPVLGRLLDRALALARRPPLERIRRLPAWPGRWPGQRRAGCRGAPRPVWCWAT